MCQVGVAPLATFLVKTVIVTGRVALSRNYRVTESEVKVSTIKIKLLSILTVRPSPQHADLFPE